MFALSPAPVMKVAEVVAAAHTDAVVCDALAELAGRFGHTAVRTVDTPGFVVNHAGRGYGTEALKILADGICEPTVLDAVLCDACGFKLGPCELLDLTGLDVSHPVMESIYHQYYEEPRYRPQALTQRMLEGGLLGRKRGVGFYRYVDGKPQRPQAAAPPTVPPPPVWIDPSRPAMAAHVRAALVPGVVLDGGTQPAGDSLIVVTPLGGDATSADKVDWLFSHMDQVASAHVAGLLFGPGTDASTSVQTDGGNLFAKTIAYQNSGGTPLK